MFTHTALRRAIARSHETPVATIARVESGRNRTYRVTLRDGSDLLLKVGTRTPDLFETGPAVMDLVRRETAVPVPEVHAVGTDPLGYPFAIYEFVADAVDDWMRDLDPEVAEQVCREAGENLATIHRLTYPTFGRLGTADGSLAVVDRHSYRDVLSRSLDRQLDALRETPFAGYRARLETRGHDLIDAIDLTDVQPALLHDDYRLDNLRVDPLADPVTVAVLDWEAPRTGDPLWDVVVTRTLLTTGYGISPARERSLAAAFRDGYGHRPEDATRWNCYELLARIRFARHLDLELAGLSETARTERITQHRGAFDALLGGGTRLRRPDGGP